MDIARCLALLCCIFCLASTQGKRVAEQKCQEYIDRYTKKTSILALLPSRHVIVHKATSCTKSVELITNGVETLEGEFPHQALLGKSEDDSDEVEFYCGGSLISERFVLTAAHCHRPTVVRLGEHNLTDPHGNQVDYMVFNYIRHPRYTMSKAYFDIALVELSRKVIFYRKIHPACLWTNDSFNNSTVMASGFGATEHDTESTFLMKVHLNVVDNAKCEEKFFGYWKLPNGIKDEQLCVGSQEGGRDTCNGDSGGPIQVTTHLDTCTYHVVGITSMGFACGIGTSESVYTKVASYVDWIEQHVWPDEWSKNQYSDSESLIDSYHDKVVSDTEMNESPNSY